MLFFTAAISLRGSTRETQEDNVLDEATEEPLQDSVFDEATMEETVDSLFDESLADKNKKPRKKNYSANSCCNLN